MALAVRSLPKKKPAPITAITPTGEPRKVDYSRLKESSLKVFDIPVEDLIDNEANPNQMDEATFDLFVQKVKDDGFDEPIQVVPHPTEENKFMITGGHHRKKVARTLGMATVPATIKEGWSEDKQKMELVSRNMLKGNIDPVKFTELYNELKKKGYDDAILKLNLGITKKDAFQKLYKSISKSLPASHRKKLEESKETITSVEGLSSTLNSIFKEHGEDLEHGFAVFQYLGKKHHHIVCDKELHNQLESLESEVREKGMNMTEVFKGLLKNVNLGIAPAKKSTKALPRVKKDS